MDRVWDYLLFDTPSGITCFGMNQWLQCGLPTFEPNESVPSPPATGSDDRRCHHPLVLIAMRPLVCYPYRAGSQAEIGRTASIERKRTRTLSHSRAGREPNRATRLQPPVHDGSAAVRFDIAIRRKKQGEENRGCMSVVPAIGRVLQDLFTLGNGLPRQALSWGG